MKRARGFALMMAIFMIVTLAAIGVYLLTISGAQLEAGAQDEQGARAYQAARTGVDWAAYQILRNSGGAFASACTPAAAVPANTSQTLALTATQLSGFRAEVGCTGRKETEGSTTVYVFDITVTGCNHSPSTCGSSVGPTYVERQLQLTLAREL